MQLCTESTTCPREIYLSWCFKINLCLFVYCSGRGGTLSMISNQITWSTRPDSGTVSSVSWYICLEVNKIGLVQFFSFRKIDTSDKLLNFRDLCFPGSLLFKLQMTPLYTLPVVFQITTPSGSSFAWINLAIDTPSRDKLKKQWQCNKIFRLIFTLFVRRVSWIFISQRQEQGR